MKIKKQKGKKGNKAKKGNRVTRAKVKHYPVEYLGIALLAFVLLEAALMGNTTLADMGSAIGILDLSGDIAATSQYIVATIDPMIEVVNGVDQFYKMAAAETEKLLDLSQAYEDTVAIVMGVNKFYELASIELENLLYLPDYAYMPQVAGASTENCSN